MGTSSGWRTSRALAVLVSVFAITSARADENRGLNVQARWRIVGVAAATSTSPALDKSEVLRALRRSGDTIARELPGIHWEISPTVRVARYEDDGSGRLELAGEGMRRLVEGLAETDDELARADFVYVYVGAPEQDFAGMSVLRAHPRGKPQLWYSAVNTRQGPRMARRAVGQLVKFAGPLGLDPEGPERAEVERAFKVLASPLDRGAGRRLALWATTVHEFGHLLAPGTADVRSVDQLHGWIQNGADEPTKHDKRCVMWTPDPESLLAKALAFPRVVQFCDGCRRRLGLPPRDARRRTLLEGAPVAHLE
jgi:hypothetical protein